MSSNLIVDLKHSQNQATRFVKQYLFLLFLFSGRPWAILYPDRFMEFEDYEKNTEYH